MSAILNVFAASSCSTATGLIVGQLVDGNNNPTNLVNYNILPSQAIMITAASGSSVIGLGGQFTTGFVIGGSAANLQANLDAIPAIGPGGVLVKGFYPYQVEFQSSQVRPDFTVGTGGLLVSSASPPLTAGSTGTQVIDSTLSAHYSQVGAWQGTANQWHIQANGYGYLQSLYNCSVVSGWYQVYFGIFDTPSAGDSASTPFRILDGSTPRVNLRLNQQVAPQQDFIAGVDCQAVASVFGTTGHSLQILITDGVLSGDIGKRVYTSKMVIVPIDPTQLLYVVNQFPIYITNSGWNIQTNNPDAFNGQLVFTNNPALALTFAWPGIPLGTYLIESLWNVFSSSTVSYQFYDNGVAIGSPTIVDQTIPPAGGITIVDSNSNPHTFAIVRSLTLTTPNLTLVITCGTGFATISAVVAKLTSAAQYSETPTGVVNNITTGLPTVKVLPSGPTLTLGDAILRQDSTLPFLEWPVQFPSQLDQNTQLAFSLSPNCITTVAGVVAGLDNVAVSNKIASRLTPATPQPTTMGVGYNTYSTGSDLPLYSNLALNCNSLLYGGSNPTPLALTSLGYPRYSTYDIWFLQFGFTAANPIDARTYPGYPLSGTTTIRYNCSAGFYLAISPFTGTTVFFQSLNCGHATGNQIQVEFTNDGITTFTPAYNLLLLGLVDWCDDADIGRFSFTGMATRHTGAGWNAAYYLDDGTGTTVFSFLLGSLPAGTYNYANTYLPSGSNSNNVTVTAKESGSTIASYSQNQTLTPGSLAATDYNAASHNFAPTGQNFTCSGGPIVITIKGDNSGTTCADCVYIKIVGNIVSGTPFLPISAPIEVYDPSIDLNNITEFHPLYRRSLGNPRVIRSMQTMGANDSGMIEYSDYAQPGQLCYGAGATTASYNLVEISNWDTPNGYFQNNKAPVLLTVAAINGATLPIQPGVPIALPNNLIVHWTSGGQSDISLYFSSVYYNPSLGMATNQFVMASGFTGDISGTVIPITPTFPATSLGICTISYKSIPWPSYFRLVASFPNCKYWINVTATASQACVTQIAADCKSIIPRGRHGYLETGNEPWNNFFSGFQYYYGTSQLNGLGDPQQAYAMIASQKHSWFATEMGDRSEEFFRVFGCQAAVAASFQSIIDYCNPRQIRVDGPAIAPYMSNSPPSNLPLSAAQLDDCTDAFLAFGNSLQAIASTYQAAVTAQSIATGRACHWCCYEGGIPGFNMGGSDPTQYRQTISSRYYPQAGQVQAGYLAILQSYGCLDICIYNLDQFAGGDFQFAVYALYQGWFNPAGPGFNNVADVAGIPPGVPNFLGGESPMGYAINQWNAMMNNSIMTLLFNLKQRMGS